MPYAVELLLDEASGSAIADAWRRVADAGFGHALHGTAARPHVTLLVADDLDVTAAEQMVAEMARTPPPMRALFSSIGVFGGGVVFAAPVVTDDLLALHRRWHTALAGVATRPWAHYAPGAWVPHCTIAIDVQPPDLAAAVALVADAVTLPLLHGVLDRVAIVEFRPVVTHAVHPLAGQGRLAR